MSRFDVRRPPRAGTERTVNLAGGEAYTRSPKVELATMVITSVLQDGAYESAYRQLERLQRLVRQLAEDGELKFAAQAAIYTRRSHGLRTISHALAGEVAHNRKEFPEGDWATRFFAAVARRPDDMTEIASYVIQRTLHGRKKKTLPNALKRGFARALQRFDAYQLSKWKGGRRQMTLRDLAHLVHAPGGKGSLIYQLREGTLKPPDTFEVRLSAAGQEKRRDVDEAKATAWNELLAAKKLPYLAALRNIRNIIEQAPDSFAALRQLLLDPTRNRKALIFPFQLQAAADAIAELHGPIASQAATMISQIANLSAQNCPALEGPSLVALDDSGSMTQRIDHRSSRTPLTIGSLFAACILKANQGEADLMLFSSDARYLTLDLEAPVLTLAAQIMARTRPYGTNFHAVFQTASRKYNRIIIMSDQQGWMGYQTPESSFKDYQRRLNANPYIYTWDLASSATSQFPEPRVCVLGGWSDKIFDLMGRVEQDPQALVHEIEAVNV